VRQRRTWIGRLIVPVALAVALTVLRAAAVTAQFPARTGGALADSLREFGLRMGRLLAAKDANGVVALYGDTTHFVHVEDGVITPWPELSRMMRAYLTTVKTNPVTAVGEPGVVLLDSNNAVLYIRHRFDGIAGGRAAHDGVWTGVLHRTGAGWKIIHSHSSDKRPTC
jgi:hypothetical protein